MFNITEITALMDKMKETGLGEVKLKSGDFELKIKSKEIAPVITAAQTVSASSIVETIEVSTPAVVEIAGNVVKSPIVGTFYAAAAPDKPPFAKVGQRVRKGDVLFVIESMKLMNEIQSEFDGEVVAIKVDNAQGVEFNQPIMIIA